MKKPIDIATRETASFIASHVPPGATVLEVGCGEGHVALALSRQGYRVAGLDSDGEIVARARARGVHAVEASWPAYEGEPVDAIAFTRSLHHIHPLRAAVGKAREILTPSGMLLVEDFAFGETDPATIRWFLDVLRSLSCRALLLPASSEFATSLLDSEDPVAAWHHGHEHELHTAPAMTAAAAEFFDVGPVQSVPYLYRYLLPVLPETAEAAGLVEEVFQEESLAAGRGRLVLLGRRITGSPRRHG